MVNQKSVVFRPITIPLSTTAHLEAVLKMRQDIVEKSYPFHRKVTSLISVVMARFLDNTPVFQISSLFFVNRHGMEFIALFNLDCRFLFASGVFSFIVLWHVLAATCT
jgi:hypothetical protein